MVENGNGKTKSKGIQIRKLNYVMASITLIVSIVLLIVSYRTLSVYNALRLKTEIFVSGQQNAHDMQNASDYLTEQARCFVESGARMYLDAYFEESEVTRRRENALDDLARTFCGTAEYTALEKAAEQSMALMQTEYYAMCLTIHAYGYDISEFPKALRDTVIENEDLALSSEEQLTKARQMVFDDNYHSKKAIISANTQECLNNIINALQNQQTDTANQFGVIIQVEQWLIIALIAIVLVIVTLTTIQVIEPLIRAIPRIREDKPIPISGAEEFRYLANTYNRIYEENKNQKEELAYEASHDQLTGVFNRKGFERILEEVSHKKVALLLIDVDRFKGINDTYGHSEGDKVLSRLTDVLSAHFRTGDSLCRIGGDEFVMFMPDVGPECRELIEQKIKNINQELKKGDGDVLPMSVSVGIAFGES